MTKRAISKKISLKTDTHCWEADGNGANLRNLLLIFTTPLIRIWNLWLKFCTEQVHLLVYYGFFTEPFPKSFPKSSKNIRCNSGCKLTNNNSLTTDCTLHSFLCENWAINFFQREILMVEKPPITDRVDRALQARQTIIACMLVWFGMYVCKL